MKSDTQPSMFRRSVRPGHEISALAFAEQFLLWSMRLWVYGQVRRRAVDRHLTEAFRKVGMPDGAFRLGDMMRPLASGAQRAIDIHCIDCAAVSPDENLLLDIVALFQAEERELAAALLGGLTTPGANGLVALRGTSLATALATAGLHVRQRPAAIRLAWEQGMASRLVH